MLFRSREGEAEAAARCVREGEAEAAAGCVRGGRLKPLAGVYVGEAEAAADSCSAGVWG